MRAPRGEVRWAAQQVGRARSEAVLDGVQEIERRMPGDELQVGDRVHPQTVPTKRALLVRCSGEVSFASALLMATIVLALMASLAWGTSDFLGGVAARGARLPLVLAGSQLAGLLAFAPVLLLHDTAMPYDYRLLLGLAAGVVAVVELGLIYLALRRGPAVVMAPIAALSAVLPVVVGITGGDHVDLLIATGLLCALGGAVGASWTRGEHRPPRREALAGAAVAGGAALGAGTVLALIDAASKADAWWAIGAVRAGGAVTAAGLLAATLAAARGAPRAAAPRLAHGAALTIAAIGVSDVAADTAFANATRGGALAVVSVLASLYPVTTIALGVVVLRERPTRVQLAGAALACVGVVILAATTR
jgi:drug/metabolite transporter (DMT)-like permease